MDASLFIARRLRFKGRIAVTSIAVSFIVMIISVSVSSGFRHEIRDGISFLSGDIQLTPVNLNYLDESSPIERRPAYLEKVEALKGVKAVSPAVYKAGIVRTGGEIHGVLFKGIENPGKVSGADSLPSLGVAVPSGLASILHLKPGDRLPSYFIGEKIRVRNFTVASVYEGMFDSDPENMVVFASLSDMQRLNGWGSNQVSALEVQLDNRYKDMQGMEAMQQEVGSMALLYADDESASVVARSAVSRYPQIFDWLNLLDANVWAILILMTGVAGFTMISGLLIIILERTNMIGVLKALGADNASIRKIFLTFSVFLIGKGMLWGNIIGLSVCLVQYFFRPLRLDPVTYYINTVPIELNIGWLLLLNVGTLLVSVLMLVGPSYLISHIHPAKSIRFE